MRHRLLPLALLAASGSLAACIELSAPGDGIEAISTLRAPYPAVLRGDTLRDSLGVAVPLAVLGFTGRGDSVAVLEGLQFFLPDTGTGARVENGYFIAGDRLGPVRVVAQVAGLQTPARAIEVVTAPTVARPEPQTLGNPAVLETLRYAAAAASASSAPMQVRVQGDTGGVAVNVNGWIVTYRITRQPAPFAAAPDARPAYLATEQGRAIRGDSATAIDTTASGVAARIVVVRPALMARATDTVEVEATVRHAGGDVPGSPIVFRIPIAPLP